VWGFLKNFVPQNAVETLASENLLAVVFMAILLGAALCRVQGGAGKTAQGFFSAIYEMFITILDWILYFLPVGLFCLLASQASDVGLDALKAMLAIIFVYMACFLLMAGLYIFQLRRATGKSIRQLWAVLKEPFTLAFVASSDSALPMAMSKMETFGLPAEMVHSVVPLSAVLNRHGTAIVFAITTVFIAHIYGMPLNMGNCLLIALSCSLVGAFDSGEYVTIAPMITYVLMPLGLPPEAGVAIILTIWPLFEWFPELQCIMAACANTAVVGNMRHDSLSEPNVQ
jgi:proton glutamate symport protein